MNDVANDKSCAGNAATMNDVANDKSCAGIDVNGHDAFKIICLYFSE